MDNVKLFILFTTGALLLVISPWLVNRYWQQGERAQAVAMFLVSWSGGMFFFVLPVVLPFFWPRKEHSAIWGPLVVVTIIMAVIGFLWNLVLLWQQRRRG
jgi:hypothetical protein